MFYLFAPLILDAIFTFLVVIFSHNPLLTTLAAAIFFTLIYAQLIEPYYIIVKKITLPVPKLTNPVKIVLIGDLQVGRHKKTAWVEDIAKKILALKPDLVLLAGDLIFNEPGSSFDEWKELEPLKLLTEKIPVAAVLGNHDYGIVDYDWQTNKIKKTTTDHSEGVGNALEKFGVTLLRNELVNVKIKNQPLQIFGTDDLWAGKTSWDDLTLANPNIPLLVLAHNADSLLSFPEKATRPTLVFCGHTHGGQVRLPFIGPLGNALTSLRRKNYQGLFTRNGLPIFITRGLGESRYSMRFFAPPEIALIEITPKV